MKGKYGNKLQAKLLLKLQVEEKKLSKGERENKKGVSEKQQENYKKVLKKKKKGKGLFKKGCDEMLNISEFKKI